MDFTLDFFIFKSLYMEKKIFYYHVKGVSPMGLPDGTQLRLFIAAESKQAAAIAFGVPLKAVKLYDDSVPFNAGICTDTGDTVVL